MAQSVCGVFPFSKKTCQNGLDLESNAEKCLHFVTETAAQPVIWRLHGWIPGLGVSDACHGVQPGRAEAGVDRGTSCLKS